MLSFLCTISMIDYEKRKDSEKLFHEETYYIINIISKIIKITFELYENILSMSSCNFILT